MPMKILPVQILGFLPVLLLVLPSPLLAADEAPTLKELVEKSDVEKVTEKVDTKITKGPLDEYGRTTPRSSVMGLAKALSNYDFETAVNYLDLRNLPFTLNRSE